MNIFYRLKTLGFMFLGITMIGMGYSSTRADETCPMLLNILGSIDQAYKSYPVPYAVELAKNSGNITVLNEYAGLIKGRFELVEINRSHGCFPVVYWKLEPSCTDLKTNLEGLMPTYRDSRYQFISLVQSGDGRNIPAAFERIGVILHTQNVETFLSTLIVNNACINPKY